MRNNSVPAEMHAAIWRGGPEVAVETVPVPEVGEGEVLVRVEACGLCPTDIKKIELGLVEPPVILGHEMAGVVVAYRNVFMNGDPVAGWMLIAPFALCWLMLGLGLAVFARLDQRFGDAL